MAVDGEVRTVADADLLDGVEEFVGRVPREHVRQPGLHPHADQGERTRLLPLAGQRELLVAQLGAALLVRALGVRPGQRHRHVHVCRTGRACRPEQGHDEARVGGVEQDVAAVAGEQPGHGVLVARVDALGAEPVPGVA